MTDARYTPSLVRWIRAHAGVLNEIDMAEHIHCPRSSLRNICRNFRIDLCNASDLHADLAPLPDQPSPPLVPEKPNGPRVHPRLNPELRGHIFVEKIELRLGREARARLDRAAAKRLTTASVLAEVLIELVAIDNLFDAVLNLED